MKTIATVNGVIFILVYGIAIYLGVDPQKWRTWLMSLYGFLTFYLAGIAGTGDFYEAVKVGVIATFALTFVGIITYRNRERAKKWLQEQEKQEEESYRKL